KATEHAGFILEPFHRRELQSTIQVPMPRHAITAKRDTNSRLRADACERKAWIPATRRLWVYPRVWVWSNTYVLMTEHKLRRHYGLRATQLQLLRAELQAIDHWGASRRPRRKLKLTVSLAAWIGVPR